MYEEKPLPPNIEIDVSLSPRDKKKIAKLYYDKQYWGFVSEERGHLLLQLEISNKKLLVPLKDVLEVLERAKHEILGK